ncbi:MAG: hypothetical protein AAF654_00255 [Myxococcota bacterium]
MKVWVALGLLSLVGCGDSESCCLATCRNAEADLQRILRAQGEELPDDVCAPSAIREADDRASCDAAFLSEYEVEIPPGSTANACD